MDHPSTVAVRHALYIAATPLELSFNMATDLGFSLATGMPLGLSLYAATAFGLSLHTATTNKSSGVPPSFQVLSLYKHAGRTLPLLVIDRLPLNVPVLHWVKTTPAKQVP